MSFRFRSREQPKRRPKWRRPASIANLRVLVAIVLLPLCLFLAWQGGLFAQLPFGDATIAKAGAMRDSGNSPEAADIIRDYVARHRDDGIGNIAQAELALDLFKPEEALTAIARARQNKVPNAQLLALSGHAYWLQGNDDKALAALTDKNIAPNYRGYAARILGRLESSRGNYAAAQIAFDRALALQPNASIVWSDLAEHRLETGNQQGAWQATDKALALNPKNVRAIELRGRIARLRQGLTSALVWFERGLKASPRDLPLLEQYAATLGEAGQATQMLAQARKIVLLNSGNGRAYYMQAVIAARAGDYPLARRILQSAGGSINELPAARMLKGISEYQTGNFNVAILAFQKLADEQPYNLDVRSMLARALLRTGDGDGALKTILPLADRSDATAYNLILAARAYEMNGRRDQAANYLNRASIASAKRSMILPEYLSAITTAKEAGQNPDDARRVIPNIRNLARAGNLAAAQSGADRLQSENPGISDAHVLAGDVASLRGQTAEAIADYRRGAGINFSEGVFLKLVDAYRLAKDEPVVRHLIRQFLRENPANWQATRLYAYTLLDDKKWAEAVPILTVLQDRIGYNEPLLMINLARAYSGLGRYEEAMAIANTAYKIAPANQMVTHYTSLIFARSGKYPKAARELLVKANTLNPEDIDIAVELERVNAKIRPVKAKTPLHKPALKKH
jgi:cellulose synthase operon protein C